MGMDTSVRVARGMARGRKGRGPRGAIGDTDSRSTSGPDPVAEDIRIVTACREANQTNDPLSTVAIRPGISKISLQGASA